MTDLAHPLYLALLGTASDLGAQSAELLRPYGLSGAAYNVLRILRGAGKPLACSAIAGRLLTRDPDVTRLLDRLEKQGLLQRQRDPHDRRVVMATPSQAGLRLLAELDEPMNSLHRRQFAALSGAEAQLLLDLLAKLSG